MSYLNNFDTLQLNSFASTDSSIHEESSVPRIVKNIEEISERYRRHLETEINEDLDKQDKQVKDIRKLKIKKNTKEKQN